MNAPSPASAALSLFLLLPSASCHQVVDVSASSTLCAEQPEINPKHATYESGGPTFEDSVGFVLGDTTTFSDPEILRFVGDKLVVIDRKAFRKILVVDTATWVIAAAFGRPGQGPGEFRDPTWISEDDDHSLWIFDSANRAFVRMDSRGSSYQETRRLYFQGNSAPANPEWLEDGIVSNGYFLDAPLALYDSSGRRSLAYGPPTPYGSYDTDYPPALLRLNRSRLYRQPRGERFALAYQAANVIHIIDEERCRSTAIRGPVESFVSYSVGTRHAPRFTWLPDNQWSYVSVAASYDNIFALYCGECDESNLPRSIHVFTWDGDLVSQITLPKGIISLAVNEIGTLLAGPVTAPYPSVRVWRLNHIGASKPPSAVPSVTHDQRRPS